MTAPMPPHDADAERALVGAFILDAGSVAELDIRPGDFWVPRHGTMWALLAGLDGSTPDRATGLLAVLERTGELKPGHLDGPYIHSCIEACTTVHAAAQYAQRVRQTATRRHALQAITRAEQRVRSTSDDDLHGTLYEAMGDLEAAINGAGPDRQGTFRRWSAAELAAQPDTFRWLVAGMLAQPTYGQLAGAMKTIKSYVGLLIVTGLAAGVPVLGHFAVPRPRPVVAYVGEGGRVPFQRRLRRVASAMGVDPAGLPLEVSFDVAPIDSDRFRRSLDRDLAEVRPGLVWLDPFYAFHGTEASPANLHDEGALLTRLHTRCLDAGATLLVNNHFNQTGAGAGLQRITMAGSGEWADTWLLLTHREKPDVEAGRFRLSLSVGSRQWGGREWALDLDIGRFDHDAGHHDGDIAWAVAPAADVRAGQEADLHTIALETLEGHPWELTRSALVEAIGGNAGVARGVVDALLQDRRIKVEEHPRREGTRLVRRQLFALGDEPGPDDQTRLDGVGAT